MKLMRFVCSFAWTDLEVGDEERAYVERLVDRLELGQDERTRVRNWLQVPPAPDDVDPTDVPREHRKLFLDALRELAEQDGRIDEEERVSLALFEQLVQ